MNRDGGYCRPSMNEARGKTNQGQFSEEDSRYPNNHNLVRKSVIIGSICVIVFTLGILLGAFSRAIDRSDNVEETGVCRFTTSSFSHMTGNLSVSRCSNHFKVDGLLATDLTGVYSLHFLKSGNPSNCTKPSDPDGLDGPEIELKRVKIEDSNQIQWSSSGVVGNFLYGRVLMMCPQGSNCSCCVVVRLG